MESLSLLLPLREYQKNIANSCLIYNTLIVLPTGLGKTLISFEIIRSFKKVLFLAPTKPLCKQHLNSFLSQTNASKEDVIILTGETKAAERNALYSKKYVFATPQTIQKDVEKDPGLLILFDLVVFDECHRATGDYAYSFIAKNLSKSCRKVGMTASPGSDRMKVMEIISLLDIDFIEYRKEDDVDVAQYVHKKEFSWVYVSLTPEMRQVQLLLKDLEKKYIDALRATGLPVVMKRSLLVSLGNVIASIKSNAKYRMFVLYSMILNLDHIITLFETQGTFSTLKFISDLIIEKGEKKAIKELTRSSDFIKAKFIMETMMKEGKEHPKMDKLILMFNKELKDKKCMVFVQYVEQAKYIANLLSKKGYPAQFFIGKRKSYNRQQQEQTLQDFRDSKFSILVASSIGEEGIDIPSTDAVIFYEPVPSEIRLIQRRGRTGRAHKGEVFILITRGTRDEAYHWVSKKKEAKMYSLISVVNEELESRRKDKERVVHEKKMVQEQKPKKKLEIREEKNINANEKSGLQRKLNDYY